jgi:copper chaperone NosL
MKKKNLSNGMRLAIFLCGVALVAVLFFPLWRIDLDAPQYPEGLMLLIYPTKLGGNVDIINGLNHYIGMKTLHADDFMEFTILPYIILFFALFSMLTAAMGSRKLLNTLFILFVVFGILAMYDFWRWEYDYGHNLNPDAAIIVPGMAYQPPLIGFKQLLNFGAYSFPDVGGWIFILVGTTLLFCVVFAYKKSALLKKQSTVSFLLIGMLFLGACTHKPKPIQVGKDNCSFCKMTISDTKFAAEILNENGKVFLFDDIKCAQTYFATVDEVAAKKHQIFFVNFLNNQEFLPSSQAILLQSNDLRTPMAGGIIACANKIDFETLSKEYSGKEISWQTPHTK